MSGRIGFVDYRLDNFHADVYLKLLRTDLADTGFTVAGCTAQEAEPSRAWARDNDVAWFDSVANLNDHVDHFVVLAPSNPETHLDLCGTVFPCGKSTYVDKTFAPDLSTALQIFDLADTHGVAMQTTSALRYTEVQEAVVDEGAANLRHLVAWGGGSSFEEYAIHPVEMAVSCLGPDVTRLLRWQDGPDRCRLLLEFSGGRSAVVHVHTDGSTTPYAAALTSTRQTRYVAVDTSRIFRRTAQAFVHLFDTGTPNVARAESLAVRRILDVAALPEAAGAFVDLS